jgi:hypothetical protein
VDLDVALLNFWSKEINDLFDERIELDSFALRFARANGLEELPKDGVESGDFRSGGFDEFRESLLISTLGQLPFEELEMETDGIERIPNFVSNARCEESERVELFGFQDFFRSEIARRLITDEDEIA